MTYAYTYNNANRLKTVSQSGNLLGTYTHSRSLRAFARGGFEQLIKRVITNSGTANGTVYTVHDVFGNVIAELDGTGATVREYIWLPEAQIAPTMGSRTTLDRPMAVVSGVNTTPALLMVHVDQLNRPIKMTSSAGAVVWSAVYSPFGGAYTLTGTETNNARFPGQWFQLEAGLHYNWHRHYDPSLGRYTQPDPLGFVDGPSVYAYVADTPLSLIDNSGLNSYPMSSPWLPNPDSPFCYEDCMTAENYVCGFGAAVLGASCFSKKLAGPLHPISKYTCAVVSACGAYLICHYRAPSYCKEACDPNTDENKFKKYIEDLKRLKERQKGSGQ